MAVLVRQRAAKGASITDSLLRSFEFDVTDSENHEWSADVTDHEIEDGSPITDHIQLKQRTLTLSGVVSNTPLDASEATPANRAVLSLQGLEEMFERRELFTVVTGLKAYDNMAITSVATPRDTTVSRNEVRVNLNLKQLKLASPEYVRIDPALLAEDVRDSAEDEVNAGSEEEQTTDEEEEEVRESLLHSFAGGLF